MHLPASANEFIRVIGLEPTIKLLKVARDWRIYIPIKPMASNHPIVIAIGADAAATLQKQFGGSLMALSGIKALNAHQRNVEIARDWLNGDRKLASIAKRYGVSPRTVDRALATVSTSEVRQQPHPPGLGSFDTHPMRVARDTA